MRVAIVQTDPEFGEITSNLNAALELASSVEANLYVFPELFATGYNFSDEQEVKRLAETEDGFTYKHVYEFARKRPAYIVYGFAEKSGNAYYNSSVLVGPGGLIGIYRKVHLYYRENLFFRPGDRGFPVFDLPIGRIGMMICFDWMYPESARTLALRGAQLIAHPSNLVMPHCPDAMVTRCLENRIFAATANRIGRENRGDIDLTYIGTSEVVSPRGEILVRCSTNDTEVRCVDVDLTLADNKKINEYNDLLADRREEFYRRSSSENNRQGT